MPISPPTRVSIHIDATKPQDISMMQLNAHISKLYTRQCFQIPRKQLDPFLKRVFQEMLEITVVEADQAGSERKWAQQKKHTPA